MQFPKEYFEDEVRDGFYVNGLMKRAWAAQLEVLEEIATVCKKHNIQWFADCGTLLGAVRHGGYIPWDDDLDICMLRDDFEKFNRIAKEELPEGYVVLNYRTDEDYWELLTRVTNGNRINLDASHLDKYHGFPFVAGIDIFPLDYLAPDSEEEEARRMLASVVQAAANREDLEDNPSEETLTLLRQVEEMTGVKIDVTSSLKMQLYNLTVSIFSLYTKAEAKEVVLMPYWITHHDHKYSLDWFRQTVQLPFEVTTISVPANYDSVLYTEYGLTYMRYGHGGGVHNYPFYKSQEEHLIQLLGEKAPFQYKFKIADLEKPKRISRCERDKQMEDILYALGKHHADVVEYIDATANLEASALLIQCQNEAIKVGTMIEDAKGEGFVTVKYIEEYCEELYSIYVQLSQKNEVSGKQVYEILTMYLKIIWDSVKNDFQTRKEIVFMPWKTSSWNSMESIWRAANEDPDCDVYVIPIPYYYKNPDGSFKELYYDGANYPEDVVICDVNEYNIASRQPDMIFINNPFDECDYTTSVPPIFYAKNLRKYTDKLVYIPYFKLDEIDIVDQKSIQGMKYFAVVPGVICADEVIVQSEPMKRRYIEVLVSHCGEETKSLWEDRIHGLGSPIIDGCRASEKKRAKLPEEWRRLMTKKDGSYKRVILYGTNISSFLVHGEQMLKKMKDIFELFKRNKNDVVLIYRPEFTDEEIADIMDPLLRERYQSLIAQYQKEGWGIYDDKYHPDELISVSDAYYGTPGGIAVRCRKRGMPVMFQSF